MKDIVTLDRYAILTSQQSTAWENPLWEDFVDVDVEEEEPLFQTRYDDLVRGTT